MWKPIAAGLMCLGFVTLSVAMSQGQDESSVGRQKNDLIVIDGKLNATELQPGETKANPQGAGKTTTGGRAGEYEARTGGEAGISADGQTRRIVKTENGDVVVSNEEEKVVEKREAGAVPARASIRLGRVVSASHFTDPQTRESLEKLVIELKEQIQKLEREGNYEKTQQKSQSLRAIEFLLHGNHGGVGIPGNAAFRTFQYVHDPKHPLQIQTMDEIKKLHGRLSALTEESSKLPQGAAGERDRIRQEIDKINKEIAEKHQSLFVPAPDGGQPPQFAPYQGFPSGMAQFTQPPQGAQGFPGGGFGVLAGQFAGGQPGQPPGFGGSEGMALLRKSEALSQAGAQLKSNGLDKQAEPLLVQAEQMKAVHYKRCRMKPQSVAPKAKLAAEVGADSA